MTQARCPTCEKEFEVPMGLAGGKARCPQCQTEVSTDSAQDPNATTFAGVSQANQHRRPTVASALGSLVGSAAPGPAVPPPPPPAAPPQETFGAFELISKLGSSDIGMTYRARRQDMNRIVALRVMLPGPTASREEIACIAERARSAHKLDHDGISRVTEVSKADGTDYAVAEFIEGKPLSVMMGAPSSSVGESVELVNTLAETLSFAHGEGVAHGNLKPTNIIVDNHAKPRITDFGLAREYWRIPAHELKTAGPDRVPVPLYMAPEQLRGAEATPLSDIYSLGAILYHLLARRPPHDARTLLELALEVDRGVIPPPSATNLRVPVSVNAIVMKCLQTDPKDRYQSAGDLAAEIDKFLRGQKVQATPPNPLSRIVRSLRTHARAAIAVGATAALAGIGSYFAARSGRTASIRGAEGRVAQMVADALARGDQGLWDEAAKDLRRLESDTTVSSSGRARAAAGLGIAYMNSGRPADAAQAFRRAVTLRPGDGQLHYLLGVALWHSGGDPVKVAEELREALALDPVRAQSPRFQYDYARACQRAGLVVEAKAAFARVRELDATYRADQVAAHISALDTPAAP